MWKQVALALLVELLLTTALEIAVTDQGVSKQSLPSPRGEAKLSEENQKMLTLHNTKRAQNCAAELKWNNDLAAYAASWIEQIEWNRLDHDPDNNKPHTLFSNENLFGNSVGATAEQAVEAWYDEIKNCKGTPDSFTDGCETGNGVTGHFTVLVWKSLTDLGCARSQDKKIYGCKYSGLKYVTQANQNQLNGGYTGNVLPQGCPGSLPSNPVPAGVPVGSAIDDPQVLELTDEKTEKATAKGQTTKKIPPASGAELAAEVPQEYVFQVAADAAEEVCKTPAELGTTYDMSPFKIMELPLEQSGEIENNSGVTTGAESASGVTTGAEVNGRNGDAVTVTSDDGWECMAGYCARDGNDHPNGQEVGKAYDTSEAVLKDWCKQDAQCGAYQINNISSNTQWKGLMMAQKPNGVYGTDAQKEVAKCCIKPAPAASLLNTGVGGFGNAGNHHLQPDAVSVPDAQKKDSEKMKTMKLMKSYFETLSAKQKGLFLEALSLRLDAAKQQSLVEACKQVYASYVGSQQKQQKKGKK